MKKMILTLAALTLVAGGALAQNNEIGIYTTPDANPDNTAYNGAPGPVAAYVVLTNPFNDLAGTPISTVGGFEFFVGIPAGVFLLGATFPAGTVNFATAPDFLCGANIPVVANRCTLITLNLGAFAMTPGFLYLKPVQNTPQSVAGEMAITDLVDDFRISVAYPVSGDHEAPVFGLWTSVVPTEDASWGELKSLFR